MAIGNGNRASGITLVAGADLSALEYTFVKLATTGKVVAGTAGDIGFGVLVGGGNIALPAADGQPAYVEYAGISRVTLGATLNAGVNVQVGSGGKAVAATANGYSMGQILQGGGDGDVVDILLGNIGRVSADV